MTWFLLVICIIVAATLYFFPAIDPTIRKIMLFVCIVLAVIWLLCVLGVVSTGGVTVSAPNVRVP